MSQTNQVVILGAGIALAAVAGVAIFLWVESTPGEDLVEPMAADVEEAAGTADRATAPVDPDQPQPAEVDSYREQDGVQVADLQEGSGESPVPGQFVKVHYRGWLQDGGKMFDSSRERGRPIEFQFETGRVIPGWHRGIAGMKVGGKRQLVIPPDLAYGEAGRAPVIPGNSTLVFEVELMELGEVREIPERPDVDWEADDRVQRMDGGIRFVQVEAGEGELTASPDNVVEAELTVWLPDGEIFFSSWSERRTPRFKVGQRGRGGAPLDGIDLGVRGMAAGGTRVLRLPPDQAFGKDGLPGRVPADATIDVQIDVLDVMPPRTPPEAPAQVDEADLTTTESGLMYVDLVEGTGATPSEGDMVAAEYSGWLQDGTLFDSSYNRMEPYRFALGRGQVIPAWDEAISTMKVGGKRLIMAPPDLAYGDRGKGDIPPGATLIFEIELVDVASR
jgi:peptidylprolyl isomerase